jgi:S1-C subfamily serine protease
VLELLDLHPGLVICRLQVTSYKQRLVEGKEAGMALLTEVKETIGSVGAKVGPSLVGVGQRWGVGSGVVVGAGRVLTNAHNIRGEELTITFADGRTETGTIAGVDVDGDIAVVNVDTKDAPALEWSGPDDVGIGTAVLALANPGGRGLRVTVGYVSGTERSFRGPRGRRISGSIEHTAPLLPGSSGGPIVDAEGKLLGLNTNRLGEGFYLAIPADGSLKERVESLAKGEAPERPRLGVAIAPAHVARHMRRAVGLPDADGLLVRGVSEDGPAGKAGIREGDLITAVDGKTVTDADELHAILDAVKKGATLRLHILRGAEAVELNVAF